MVLQRWHHKAHQSTIYLLKIGIRGLLTFTICSGKSLFFKKK